MQFGGTRERAIAVKYTSTFHDGPSIRGDSQSESSPHSLSPSFVPPAEKEKGFHEQNFFYRLHEQAMQVGEGAIKGPTGPSGQSEGGGSSGLGVA